MKKDIYIEVLDATEKYSSYNEYDIFNRLHEEIKVFDKYVIEGNLISKIDEVLSNFSQLSSHSFRIPIFDTHSNFYLVEHFAKYLEFRYYFDYLFKRDKSREYSMDFNELKKYAMEDFSILHNRFLDSQFFYAYGRFDIQINSYPIENSIPENYVRIDSYSRNMAYLILVNGLRNAFMHKVRLEEDSLECLFYGKLSFDPLLQVNVINVSQFYHD